MFYPVIHYLNSYNFYLQEQELCQIPKVFYPLWLAHMEVVRTWKKHYTNLSSCAMISMMVTSSTHSPVAMAEYALEPRAAWGDNCRKEERKRGLEQQWYNKRIYCDEQLVRKIVLIEGNIGWIFTSWEGSGNKALCEQYNSVHRYSISLMPRPRKVCAWD